MLKLGQNKIIQNYLYNVSYQIVVTILPIITVPYLTRVLGAENLGIARYVESVVTLFTVFGMLGLVWYANRVVAYNRQNKHDLSKCFWEIFIMRIALLLGTLLVYVCYLQGSEYKEYYLIYVIHIVGTFLDTSWFFAGMEEMKPIVLRNYVVRGLFTASLFVFVRSRNDLPVYIWLLCLMTFVNAVLILPWIKKYIMVLPLREIHFARHILPSLALFLPQAASQLYVQCDKVMLKNMIANVANVSYYTENEKIAKLPIILASALSTVLMPRIAYEFSRGKNEQVRDYIQKALFSVCFVLMPCCFGMMAVASNFVPFFLGDEFKNTYPILVVLCPTMVFIGISNVTGIQYLVAVDKKKELTISYMAALIINLIINYLLIPKFDGCGAAVGTVVAEGTAALIQYRYMKKSIGSTMEGKTMLKLLGLSALMGAVVYLVNFLGMGYLLTLILQILLGIGIFGAGVVALHLFPGRK